MIGENHGNILVNLYVIPTSKKFNNNTNIHINRVSPTAVKSSPISDVRQSVRFSPPEKANICINQESKSSLSRESLKRSYTRLDASACKAFCFGLIIGMLFAAIPLAALLTLWLHKTPTDSSMATSIAYIPSSIATSTAYIPSSIVTTASVVTTMATTSGTTSTTTVPWSNPCNSGTVWNTTGVIYAGTSTSGNALNQLNMPTGLYIDSVDTLYITDSTNCRIMAYSYNANIGSIVAGTGTCGSSLNQLNDNARYPYVDSNRNIYVSDRGNGRVIRWTNGSSTGTIVAGNGINGNLVSEVSYAYGLWVDSSSNIFVAEMNNSRVTKWTPGNLTGTVVAGVSGSAGNSANLLGGPAGIYYDEINQDLYICNAFSSTVMKWRIGDSSGTILAGISGNPGSNASQLNSPTGIVVDPWKNLYVNDRGNNRVQLFCSGNLTGITIVGQRSSGQALSEPYSIRLDSHHNLYVAEHSAGRVTRFNKL